MRGPYMKKIYLLLVLSITSVALGGVHIIGPDTGKGIRADDPHFRYVKPVMNDGFVVAVSGNCAYPLCDVVKATEFGNPIYVVAVAQGICLPHSLATHGSLYMSTNIQGMIEFFGDYNFFDDTHNRRELGFNCRTLTPEIQSQLTKISDTELLTFNLCYPSIRSTYYGQQVNEQKVDRMTTADPYFTYIRPHDKEGFVLANDGSWGTPLCDIKDRTYYVATADTSITPHVPDRHGSLYVLDDVHLGVLYFGEYNNQQPCFRSKNIPNYILSKLRPLVSGTQLITSRAYPIKPNQNNAQPNADNNKNTLESKKSSSPVEPQCIYVRPEDKDGFIVAIDGNGNVTPLTGIIDGNYSVASYWERDLGTLYNVDQHGPLYISDDVKRMIMTFGRPHTNEDNTSQFVLNPMFMGGSTRNQFRLLEPGVSLTTGRCSFTMGNTSRSSASLNSNNNVLPTRSSSPALPYSSATSSSSFGQPVTSNTLTNNSSQQPVYFAGPAPVYPTTVIVTRSDPYRSSPHRRSLPHFAKIGGYTFLVLAIGGIGYGIVKLVQHHQTKFKKQSA